MRISAPSLCPSGLVGTQTSAACAGLAGFVLSFLMQSHDNSQNSAAPQFGMGCPSQACVGIGVGTQPWLCWEPVLCQGQEGVTGAPVALPPLRTVLLWVTFNSQQTRSVGLGLPVLVLVPHPAVPRGPTGCPTPRRAPQSRVPPPCPVPSFPAAIQARRRAHPGTAPSPGAISSREGAVIPFPLPVP